MAVAENDSGLAIKLALIVKRRLILFAILARMELKLQHLPQRACVVLRDAPLLIVIGLRVRF